MSKLSRMAHVRVFASLALGLSGGGAAVLGLASGSAGASTTCDTAISAAAGSVCDITGYTGFSAITGHSGENLINTYYKGLTVDATTKTITASLDSRQGSGAPALKAGDTILVLENQGALTSTVANPTPVDNTTFPRAAQSYGSVSGLTAGTYQMLTVASVSVSGTTTTITTTGAISSKIAAALAVSTGNTAFQSVTDFQVVRVPTISGDAVLKNSLTALPWSAASGDGGVLALDVTGQLDMGGMKIDVNGEGFAGGAAPALGGLAEGAGPYPADGLSYPGSDAAHGQKGEGISGTPNQTAVPTTSYPQYYVSYTDSYPKGDFGMGALGNAGGGSTNPDAAYNDESTGGGGGGNAGAGGQGGYSWATGLNEGGYGGFALTPAISSLFFGGGGGGGSIGNNPADAGSGGAGGGAVFLQLGGIKGAGTIEANGTAGSSTVAWGDGGSGGGAGGTIVVQTSTICDNVTSSLVFDATGGAGGNAATQSVEAALSSGIGQPNANGTATGPGGGGGGGAILTNLASPLSTSVTGGAAGSTQFGSFVPASVSHQPANPSSPTPTELNYGATAGATGKVSAISASAAPTTSTTNCPLPTTTTVAPTTTTIASTVITVPSTPTGVPVASKGWLAAFAAAALAGAALVFPWESARRRKLGGDTKA